MWGHLHPQPVSETTGIELQYSSHLQAPDVGMM